MTEERLGGRWKRDVLGCSPLALEISARSQHRDALVHHPFTNTEIAVEPSFNFFALCDFVRVQAGANVIFGRSSTAHAMLVRLNSPHRVFSLHESIQVRRARLEGVGQ